MSKEIILSTAYLPPIQYFTKFVRYNKVIIEAHENFIKQTYRNRCKIYGANGELSLSIPVKKSAPKTKIKELLIDYDTNWRKLHWKSIESAYNSSPYFEYYIEDFSPFYSKKYKYLFDFNNDLLIMILKNLEISTEIDFTKTFYENDTDLVDFREKIHPKKTHIDKDFEAIEYTQVFHEKHNFLPNLSIVDLLFNEGPNSSIILGDT